jgi:hypothetical protein
MCRAQASHEFGPRTVTNESRDANILLHGIFRRQATVLVLRIPQSLNLSEPVDAAACIPM